MHLPDGKGNIARYMVPLLDMANHSDHPNAALAQDSSAVYLRAIRPIKKGEEVSPHLPCVPFLSALLLHIQLTKWLSTKGFGNSLAY